ncbi:tetratricopeptide repeat protein [Novosphingobium sp. 1949]|uniref:Tetratricopeptide repeat protein n=1 Tax=Novosphingobium organovorum TaxID=2930092 RepID=A0ABT0BHM5_9SPHN|nr:tetratricopeptide repeat protein [Novosphingobium organovorum]MCJ2184571.1 tetratricopeptide repeat protein [Novosphingobium organovorum]
MALPPDSKPAPSSKAAALKAAQEDVFVREVDDALRQDRLEDFVKGKGVLALGAGIVVVLAALGGWLYWNHHQANLRAERAEQFVQALDSVNSGNLDAAKAKLTPLAEGEASASALNAQLMLAAIAQEKDDAAGAAKIYDKVAADTTAPQPMRDLATVRGVAARFDTMKPQDVVDRLKPLTQPGNAWFGVAAEMAGMAYIKMNKPDQAGPLFAAVAKDEKAPEGLRSRARQLAAVLGVDAVADVVDAQGEPIGGDSKNDDAKSGKAAE